MWRLAARGADVIGYDRYAPGHDRGAAGGETRIFRSGNLWDAAYIPLLHLADRMWEQLQLETGRECNGDTRQPMSTPKRVAVIGAGTCMEGDVVSPITRQPLWLRMWSSIADHDLDHEPLDRAELARRYPQHVLPEGHTAVLDRAGGTIRPEASVRAAAWRAEQLGDRLHRYTPVREVMSAAGGGVDVVTDNGTEHVDTAVVTAGPWINTLLPDLSRAVEVLRVINSWHIPTTHDWFAGGAPAFVRSVPHACYGLPSPDGMSVKIGMSRAHYPHVPDPERLDRTVDPRSSDCSASSSATSCRT